MESQSAGYRYCKCAVAILVISLLCGLFIFFIVETEEFLQIIVEFSEWIEKNPIIGMFALFLVYVIGTTLMMPGSFFSLIMAYMSCRLFGNVWGFMIGVLLLFLASSTGALLAFLLSRYLLADIVKGWIFPNCLKIIAIYNAMEVKGLKIVLLCRLSPIIPYNVVNYVMGASNVKVTPYLLGGLGMLPMICLVTYIAMTAKNISEALKGDSGLDDWYWAMIVIGGMLLLLIVVYITCMAKKQLNEIILLQDINSER